MKYKVGDVVIGVSNDNRVISMDVKGRRGTVIYVDGPVENYLPYYVEFKDINKGLWCREDQLENINSLKLKKLLSL